MIVEYELKCGHKAYRNILYEILKIVIVKNDRNFKMGEFIRLREIDDNGKLTDANIKVLITFIVTSKDHPGIAPDYVVMGIEKR